MRVLFLFSFHYTDQISTTLVLLNFTLHLVAAKILMKEVRLHRAMRKQPPSLSLTVSASGQLLGLAFLLFVHLNHGVVVGDRKAHTATLHHTQLLYFSVF